MAKYIDLTSDDEEEPPRMTPTGRSSRGRCARLNEASNRLGMSSEHPFLLEDEDLSESDELVPAKSLGSGDAEGNENVGSGVSASTTGIDEGARGLSRENELVRDEQGSISDSCELDTLEATRANQPAIVTKHSSTAMPSSGETYDTSPRTSRTQRRGRERRPSEEEAVQILDDIERTEGHGRSAGHPLASPNSRSFPAAPHTAPRPHTRVAQVEIPDDDDMDPDEADDLRRAIAMSLAEQTGPDEGHTGLPAPASSDGEDTIVDDKEGMKPASEPGTIRGADVYSEHSSGAAPSRPLLDHGPASTQDVAAPEGDADPARSTVTPESRGMRISTSHASAGGTFDLSKLDRRAMEADRMARLKRKREAEDSTAASCRTRDGGPEMAGTERGKSKTVSISPPPLRRGGRDQGAHGSTESRGARTVPSAPPTWPGPASAPSNSVSKPAFFPAGKVLQTYVEGFPAANTISFTELVGPKDSLTSCLLSSFIWDFDWLFPHFATTRTKFQLVMHAKRPGEEAALREDFQGVNNVRLCFPPMASIVRCMHSKLMLLFYDASEIDQAVALSTSGKRDTNSATRWQGPRCRIVVPTANLTRGDWGVGGVMENSVFLIDLPLTKHLNPDYAAIDGASSGERTAFQNSLVAFLQAQTVPGDVSAKLEQFDFSATAQFGFVHTIGGVHDGERSRATGLCGLGSTVTEMGLASASGLQLDFVTSSVGSLNDEFMKAMYAAAQGDDGQAEHMSRAAGSAKLDRWLVPGPDIPTKGLTAATVTDDWRPNFRFFFPSNATVHASRGGPASAGTICFSDKWWQSAKFPRQNMRDCVSVRKGCLMHNKLIFARFPAPLSKSASGKTCQGWVYVGSANLSESAWGRIVPDKTTGSPKLHCRNWECGVVVPVKGEVQDSDANGIKGDLTAMDRSVPVPMRYPGEGYVGDRKPWLFWGGTTQ